MSSICNELLFLPGLDVHHSNPTPSLCIEKISYLCDKNGEIYIISAFTVELSTKSRVTVTSNVRLIFL